MSFAETNEAQQADVAQRAGYAYSYSLSLTFADLPYTLSGQDQRLVEYDTIDGIGTVKLPPAPDDFMEFEFSEVVGSANALTVDGNGKNIDGFPTATLNTPGMVRIYRYSPTAGQWLSVGGIR